jgi:hypothetical protein
MPAAAAPRIQSKKPAHLEVAAAVSVRDLSESLVINVASNNLVLEQFAQNIPPFLEPCAFACIM